MWIMKWGDWVSVEILPENNSIVLTMDCEKNLGVYLYKKRFICLYKEEKNPPLKWFRNYFDPKIFDTIKPELPNVHV